MKKARIIFPQDRDLLEDTIEDALRDMIHSKLTDLSDGEKKIVINFGSTHHVKFYLKNGKINSVVRCKDINGTRISYIQYVDDERTGMYMKFRGDGVGVSVCGSYKSGKPYGVWKYYDYNDKVIKEEKYDIW